ncbi:enolase C-terminal domain-like protein [Nonomuraea sp. NPDC050536]|uniref:enolase C-terminal domain-like protein n=1 Tax=Nonomuraea sp. NPDC050536 TaxID=3364366 RepID=UPI0037C534E3
MCSAKGAYTAKQAIRLAREVDDCDIGWFEEPVSSGEPEDGVLRPDLSRPGLGLELRTADAGRYQVAP